MVSNYGRRRPEKKKGQFFKQLFWAVSFFLCGYLAATVFDFTSLSSWVSTHIHTHVLAVNTSSGEEMKQEELPKPKFEFYTLLTKDHPSSISSAEVVDAKPDRTTLMNPIEKVQKQPRSLQQEVPNSARTTPITQDTYMIQMASFKKRQDAEHMRANLVLKGFNATVVATMQQEMDWFRVVVGPFSSHEEAEKIQLFIAQSEKINGIIRKADV